MVTSWPRTKLLLWRISLAGWYDRSNEQIRSFSFAATIWEKMPNKQNCVPQKFSILIFFQMSAQWGFNLIFQPSEYLLIWCISMVISWYDWLSEDFRVWLIIMHVLSTVLSTPWFYSKLFFVGLFQWFSNLNNTNIRTNIQLYCCKSLLRFAC